MKETMVSKKIIKAEEMDPKFKYIMKKHGAERLALCYQCGTCTSDCPVTKYSSFYHPRRLARMIQLGLKDRLLSNDHIWLCIGCYTCVDHCPQDVKPATVIRALKELIVTEQKKMPLVYKELASILLQTGYVYMIPESRVKRREQRGLPPLPRPNLNHLEKIFKMTGFEKTLKELETFEKVQT